MFKNYMIAVLTVSFHSLRSARAGIKASVRMKRFSPPRDYKKDAMI